MDDSKKLKLYISGPMTGYDNFNFAAFKWLAARLEALGHEVLDPSRNGCELSRQELLAIDVGLVVQSDFVVVMPGWWASEGACLEVALARAIGRPILNPDLTVCRDSELDEAGTIHVIRRLERQDDGEYVAVKPFTMAKLKAFFEAGKKRNQEAPNESSHEVQTDNCCAAASDSITATSPSI